MSPLERLQRFSVLIALIVFLNLCLMPAAQATSSASATPALTELMRKAVENYKAREAQKENYTYLAHVERTDFDRHGKVFDHNTVTYEIMFLEGAPYRRTIRINEQPLSPDQARVEQSYLEAEARARQAGNTSQQPAPTSFLAPAAQLPDEFYLRSRGKQNLDGRDVQVVEALPKGDGESLRPEQEYACHFTIKLWIDTAESQIVRLEARVVKSPAVINQQMLSFAGLQWSPGLQWSGSKQVRRVVSPGTLYAAAWTRVNQEAWLPTRAFVKAKESVLDLTSQPTPAPLPLRYEMTSTFSEYKKFRVGTHVVPK